jgi:hypothetical protein
LRGKRQPGQQWRQLLAFSPSSTFEYEPAAAERPRANRRPAAATDGAREPGRVHLDVVELRQRTTDGKCELRAGTEPGMWRKGTMHAQPRAARVTAWGQVCKKSAGKVGGAIRILSSNLERCRRPHRHDERWCRSSRTNTAKPPPKLSAKVESAKMESGWRLDKDRLIRGYGVGAAHA